MSKIGELPKAGYCRLGQIIGDKKAKPCPIPPLIPVSKTAWYNGIKKGIFPRPVHAGRCAMWRWEDIRKLIDGLEGAKPET